MISCCSWTISLVMNIKSHSCHVHHVWIVSSMLIGIFSTIQWDIIVIKLHWVACTPILSLFPKLSLSNCLRNVLSISIYIIYSISLLRHDTWAILRWIEELSRHHHLLLICIGSLPLIHQIEINTLSISIRHRCTDPTAIPKSISSTIIHYLIHIILLGIGIELLPCIATFHLIHEVSINHGISHLDMVVLWKLTVVSLGVEASDFCLVHWVLFSLNVWKHVVDSGIVSRLKHDSIVSCVHFINA